ncbi:MAG: valine--tRNA ligase [Planctomycetes bacterium]|nr:valine--tRNA ligase [Planctomycetota bacterium]
MSQAQKEAIPNSAAELDASGLPKSYRPGDHEGRIAARWKESGCFRANPDSKAEPFTIFIPPPNVTAALHLGHALNNTLQDALARQARMRGRDVLWLPGTDHASISTQGVIERRLALQGKKRTDYTREAFVALAQAWKDEYERVILEQLVVMGCSCDYDRTRFTMDSVCTAAVREAFFRLFKEGLIERGYRLANWDPVSRTAIADDETEMREVEGRMWYLKYPLSDGSGTVTVATTRPETMLGDTAVAINPKDPRAAALRGKKVRLPIVGREIPIVEDSYVVMPLAMGGDAGDAKAEVATGFLKVTPAHDPNDFEIGRRHNLAVINVLGPDASISDRHGWKDVSAEAKKFVGMSREDARKAVVAWFRANGLLENERPWNHAVGHSERSGAVIEPWLSDQWFVRVTDERLRGAALKAMVPDQFEGKSPAGKAVGDGELRFFPSRYARTFQSWHESLRDWCISRQLWWGHRIPVWTRDAKDEALAQSAALRGAEMQPVDSKWTKLGAAHRMRKRDDGSVEESVCLPLELDRLAADLNAAGFTQDPDVLDTWFSSALWPMGTLGWPHPEKQPGMKGMLERYNPSTVLCTAREIITLWVSRMTMFNRYFLGGKVPFRQVYIHPVIQDGFGQKMSKTLGNGLDPRDVIHSHGADAMRFTMLDLTTDTQDVRMQIDMVDPESGEAFEPAFILAPSGHKVAAPIQKSPKNPLKTMVSSYGAASGVAEPSETQPLARNTSSRFDLGRNVVTKLWNAARFALMNATAPATEIDPAARPLLDRWILSRVAGAVARADRALAEYKFSEYAASCYDLLWRDYCDWYLEAAKPTAKNDPAQQCVMACALSAIVRLLHPAMPYVTEALWPAVSRHAACSVRGLQLRPSELLATAGWPVAQGSLSDPKAEAAFARAQSLVEAIRNVRGERQVPPKKRIKLLAGAKAMEVIALAGGVVETLAGVDGVVPAGPSRSPVAAAMTFEGEECWLDGLVDQLDAGAERTRLTKLLSEKRRSVDGYRGKLSNAGYVAKAPPEVVEDTRNMLVAAEAELAAVERSLKDLG